MVEFAVVVVLLIALLYGIITYGLILAAQATVTQAAADATRAGITSSAASAPGIAETEACNDIGWMNKTCGPPATHNDALCTFSPNPADAITAYACSMPCPSLNTNTCLKVTVTYNNSSSPLFPVMPGLGVITPSTISSTNILQLSTPSS